MKTTFHNSQKRGSALLIVLGFLSFLIISSVSFAIYMRLERQASSNYRHATMARHLLNSALFRAMDEIDSELRISTTTNNAIQAPKFPDWPGRTRPSAVPNGKENGEEARVLSMEALSYIPAIFVNDVRRYAVTNKDDVVYGVDGNQNKYSYLGAKWRPLSMPVNAIAGPGSEVNAYEEAVVGRYAYLCVNLSDMLDVNVCRASVRDASTNHVSIGHLFATDAACLDFDTNFRNNDYGYQTLQDFYACMEKRGDTTFGSPIYNWMAGGGNSAFNTASKHILVAGGMSKPEPTKSTVAAVNIADKIYRGTANVTAAADAFATQLSKIPDFSDCSAELKCMLMDYLDEDNAPYWKSLCEFNGLYRPTTEMVPMIYRIILPTANFLKVKVEKGASVTSGTETHTKYNLVLTAPDLIKISIETLFPFKHWNSRKGKKSTDFTFKLETRAHLVALKFPSTATTDELELSTRKAALLNKTPNLSFHFELTEPNPDNPMPASESEIIKTCTSKFSVPATSVIELYTKKDDDGTIVSWANGFASGDKIRIALVVFACIKNNDGKYVDMAPGYFNPGANPDTKPSLDFTTAISESSANGIIDRLYFETKDTILVSDSMDSSMLIPVSYPVNWTSLVVPDPRYNHKASNWIKGTEGPGQTTISTVTTDLLGQDGRDGDVYQFVSNQGRLFSPGEFGFLPRPFPAAHDQAADKQLVKNVGATDSEDKDHMFRTIRLYPQGSQSRDPVYDYFKVENADGTAIGAHVNPLSTNSVVLSAAIERMPVDYWHAAALDPVSDATLISANTFSSPSILATADWQIIKDGWFRCLSSAKSSTGFNSKWNVNLSDVYYDPTTFGWYNSNQKTIFGSTLSSSLNEIDRKMLYSFSLDSFSDRQQLFLYILRAEATVPSLGGKTKSLAGGRAVALVWRDPYPVGYSKTDNTWLNKDQNKWYQQLPNHSQTLKRISPWYQVNKNKYDEDNNVDDFDPTQNFTRLDGYHEQKILFFKLLEN